MPNRSTSYRAEDVRSEDNNGLLQYLGGGYFNPRGAPSADGLHSRHLYTWVTRANNLPIASASIGLGSRPRERDQYLTSNSRHKH